MDLICSHPIPLHVGYIDMCKYETITPQFKRDLYVMYASVKRYKNISFPYIN